MQTVIKVLIGLAALAFIIAVIEVAFTGVILGIKAESLSRACTNLALIAIALSIAFKNNK